MPADFLILANPNLTSDTIWCSFLGKMCRCRCILCWTFSAAGAGADVIYYRRLLLFQISQLNSEAKENKITATACSLPKEHSSGQLQLIAEMEIMLKLYIISLTHRFPSDPLFIVQLLPRLRTLLIEMCHTTIWISWVSKWMCDFCFKWLLRIAAREVVIIIRGILAGAIEIPRH